VVRIGGQDPASGRQDQNRHRGQIFRDRRFRAVGRVHQRHRSDQACAYGSKLKAEIDWINSEAYEKEPHKLEELKQYDGVVIPGASVRAASKARSRPSNSCGKTKYHFWDCATGCSWRSLSTRAMFWGWPMPTRRRSTAIPKSGHRYHAGAEEKSGGSELRRNDETWRLSGCHKKGNSSFQSLW